MTYYLRIIVDPSEIGQFAGIKFYTVSSAYRVYINDELKLCKGQPSRSEQGFQSDRSSHLLHLTLLSDTLNLIMHVSNFSLKNYGGVSQPIVFGTFEELEKLNFGDFSKAVFFITVFFLFLILNLFMYFIRGKEISHLYIAIISGLFMLKILTENDHLMLKFISWIDLSVEYKLWNATLLLTPVLINFTQRIFPNEIPEKLASWAVGIFAVMLLVILFLPL